MLEAVEGLVAHRALVGPRQLGALVLHVVVLHGVHQGTQIAVVHGPEAVGFVSHGTVLVAVVRRLLMLLVRVRMLVLVRVLLGLLVLGLLVVLVLVLLGLLVLVLLVVLRIPFVRLLIRLFGGQGNTC